MKDRDVKLLAVGAAGVAAVLLLLPRKPGSLADAVAGTVGDAYTGITGALDDLFVPDSSLESYGSRNDPRFLRAHFPANVERWRSTVEQVAHHRAPNFHNNIILSVILQESGGIPTAQGSAGEVGLMQLKLAAVQDLGWTSVPWDAKTNIEGGVRYLELQYGRVRGVEWSDRKPYIYHALRAYNQGFAGAQRNLSNGAAYANQVLNRARA
jgi:soluble lytic murein transglycosylase-like protein